MTVRTNWHRVAATLRRFTPKKFYHADDARDFALAIELCERQAEQQAAALRARVPAVVDTDVDAIWQAAHELAKAIAFPDWPLTPTDREDPVRAAAGLGRGADERAAGRERGAVMNENAVYYVIRCWDNTIVAGYVGFDAAQREAKRRSEVLGLPPHVVRSVGENANLPREKQARTASDHALAYARENGGVVFAGRNIDRRSCVRKFSALALEKLARDGYVTLSLSPDGGMMATVVERVRVKA